MKYKNFIFIPLLACIFFNGAMANWQYPGTYVGDGWWQDDGARFVLSFRGGASVANAAIKNNMGSLTSEYYIDPTTGVVVSAEYWAACTDGGGCENYVYAGVGELAELPASKDFSSFSFAAGASIGLTIPNAPQWRMELGWDHITENEYNSSPLYEGEMNLVGGDVSDVAIYVQSGSVQSTVSTDIISAMFFYDFFDGLYKPLREIIPYVGFGLGYADSKTIFNLSDLYGDLSSSVDLQNFGELDEYGILQFYRSETSSSNIAALVSAGFSYGLSEGVFLDLGARLAYISKIKWALTNKDNTRQRDWFSANNVIYANFMLGLRFEF